MWIQAILKSVEITRWAVQLVKEEEMTSGSSQCRLKKEQEEMTNPGITQRLALTDPKSALLGRSTISKIQE
jgi:hypothetical protein